ncbi:MAG: ABC transporter substrate-binding protein [Bacteroidales bacterium]
MNKRLLIIGILIVSFLQSANTYSQSVTRIVSLAQSLTKNIYFLEAQSKLVGCTSYCDTAIADGKEVVASAVKVNIEKVVSLKPNLVITTAMTDPETIEMIRKFNIRVEIFDTAKSFNEICEQLLQLAKLINSEDNAIKVINQCKERINQLSVKNKGNKQPSIFFQIGTKPLFTVIPNTFMNDYIVLAGGKNIVTNTKTGIISREAVIASNPDVIFIVTMGIVDNDEKSVWENCSTLNAAKSKKIFIIDSNEACTPTPVTFVKTLEKVINLTYSK